MPCFKSKNAGRTPQALRAIEKNQLEALAASWDRFAARPFPRKFGGRDVAGVCVTLLDSDSAGIISSALAAGRLPPVRRRMLGTMAANLQTVLPHLDGEAADYFRDLAQLMDQALKDLRAPERVHDQPRE